MKKILMLLCVLVLLTSCGLVLGGPVEEGSSSAQVQQTAYTTLDCIDTFAVNGKVYTSVKVVLPSTVYNPNMYSISIMVNGSAILTLESHEEKRLH